MIKKVGIILTLVTALLLTACGGKKEAADSGKSDKKIKKITFNLESEPDTMDPQIMTSSKGILIGAEIYEGLTRLGKHGEPVPGVAKSWDIDGSKWTFHLRDNAKWSNGKPVTANDFAFALERAMNPETASEYAYMTYYIKNAQAYNEGKIKDFSKVGVKVVDDKTLVLDLGKPAAYFASVVSFPTYLPVNEEYFNSKGDEFALEAENILFNGPFVMKKWEHESKMILVKNENYWNKDEIKIDELDALMINQTNTALNMYKNGQLDQVLITGDELPDYKDSPELHTYSDGSVWYLEFNTKDKIMSNRKIREALTIAINRKELVDIVKKDGSKPGQGLVPYGMPGKDKGFRKDFGDTFFKDGDVEKAKKLFAEGLKEIGHTGPVTIKMLTGNNDRATKEAQFYQEQLRKALGIDIEVEQVTYQIRLQRMTAKDFQIVLAGWGPDYNDPMTYMDLWITGGGNNHTSWSNAEYDKLIQKGYTSGDNTERMEAMAKAEQILLREFPIGVTFYRNRNSLVKPNVKGIRFSGVAQEMDFYYADVEEE